VNVGTVCRWQRDSPELAAALEAAEREAQQRRPAPRPMCRVDPLSVPCHPRCPRCEVARAVLARTESGKLYFWQCGTWPDCPWRSWRPRHPQDCPMCERPRFWSHSRRSVHCPHCKTRVRADLTGCLGESPSCGRDADANAPPSVKAEVQPSAVHESGAERHGSPNDVFVLGR
jgi:hypothetical protein